MGLSAEQLRASCDALAACEPAFAAAIGRVGYPAPRLRARGYATLLRTILGQQVSVASAEAVWRKLNAVIGDADRPRGRRGSPPTSNCAAPGCRGKRRAMRAAWQTR